MERLALPAVRRFDPDVLIIACGFDAAAMDPLGLMMAHQATFADMAGMIVALADEVCDGHLMMAHEGGYSEAHVPFCGHAVLATMSASSITAPDPYGGVWLWRQPGAAFDSFVSGQLDEQVAAAGLWRGWAVAEC